MVDNREPLEIKQLFKNALGENVTFENLEIADYTTFSRAFYIERKSVEDLIASIFDGRYREQVYKLALKTKTKFIMIEGSIDNYLEAIEDRHKRQRFQMMLDSVLASISVKYKINLLYTRNLTHTFNIILKLYTKSQEMPVAESVFIRKKSLPDAVNVWMAFPQISETLALRIHEQYSLMDICNMILALESEQEGIKALEKIDGIGKKKAEKIVDVIFQKKKQK
ncbi:MAG: ERCC4 domain-containing protein [Promethearchaeota archaeon]